ncbi:ATP-binding cassette domain-containing protein [Paenibacillus rhizoplanae]
MGRSGSGKSTLLNILAGLEQADCGNYYFWQYRCTGIECCPRCKFLENIISVTSFKIQFLSMVKKMSLII